MRFIKNHLVALLLILTIVVGETGVTAISSATHKPSSSQNTTASQNSGSKLPTCDGTSVTSNCEVDGTKYSKYVYHPSVATITHVVQHPAVTHTVTHCTPANEGKYAGSCATARCADGSYTGANPSYSWTCNYHGGVVAVGPFNDTEPVTDQAAYDKTVTNTPAQAAYYDKVTE
ncbi:MAG: hypothetical protein WAW91_02845 [Candidatus Nanoperiomorbaceae bacterium]